MIPFSADETKRQEEIWALIDQLIEREQTP